MARRKLAGLRMLVTGASQGIGRAIVVEGAKRGAKMLAAARSEALLGELTRKCAARAASSRRSSLT
jgi:short-subunit dehydrogenase